MNENEVVERIEEEETSNNEKTLIGIGLALVGVIATGIGGYFGYRKYKKNKSEKEFFDDCFYDDEVDYDYEVDYDDEIMENPETESK